MGRWIILFHNDKRPERNFSPLGQVLGSPQGPSSFAPGAIQWDFWGMFSGIFLGGMNSDIFIWAKSPLKNL